MRKRAIVTSAIAVLLLLAAAYLWGPSSTPPGQQPLIVLSSPDLREFADAFDRDSDAQRMVLLLSPT